MSTNPVPEIIDELPAGTIDAVVIGGGPAGLNGALMLARSRRSVVVLDSGSPRNAPAIGVHGLLGLDGTSPAELLRRGREEVRSYGGAVVPGRVIVAEPAPTEAGDLRFTITLADGRRLTTRRVLVATGLRDVLPDIPGLAAHWGRDVVHCPYCHGWEVRDEPIGVLGIGPASMHQAMLFRQLTDDLIFFTGGIELTQQDRERLAARDIRVVDTPVQRILEADDGGIAGVGLVDGSSVPRRVLAVATSLQVRSDGLDGLGLAVEELPGNMGRRFASGLAGTTEVLGVWVAGNAADPMAQVGASAAAGALAGAHINASLVTADTDAAVATAQPRARR